MSGVRRRLGNDGLTLVELLVTVIIIAAVTLAGGRFLVEQVRQVSVSESRTQAAEYAIEELERIKLLEYDSIMAVAPEPVPNAPGFMRSVAVRDMGGESTDLYVYRIISVTVTPPSGLQPVTVNTAVAPF